MTEEELLNKVKFGDREAKDTLIIKYRYIIDILIKKYYNVLKSLNIEINDMEQLALLEISDAIDNYKEDKNAKLVTFISLCVDRRIKKTILKYSNHQNTFMNNTFSLDYDYTDDGMTLKDLISDDSKNDPLNTLTVKEDYEELLTKIKEVLSSAEYEVFTYYVNGFDYNTIALITDKNVKQIDNTIQRLKHKIRDIIRDN